METGKYSIISAKLLMRKFNDLTIHILKLQLKSIELKLNRYNFLVIYVFCLIYTIINNNFVWFFVSAGLCLLWVESYNYVITKKIVASLETWKELNAMLVINISRLNHEFEIMDKLSRQRERHVKAIQQHFYDTRKN